MAAKRPLGDKENKTVNKKQKIKSEQNAPKTTSNKLEATKTGQPSENFTNTQESIFLDGDKSVPKGWKISSHKEEDGRAWVICPEVFYRIEMQKINITQDHPIHPSFRSR